MLFNENNVLVYKSLSDSSSKWIICHRDGLFFVQNECPFGGFVYEILNTINSIINKKSVSYNYSDAEVLKLKKRIEEDPQWTTVYNRLCEDLSNLDNKNTDQIFKVYNNYKFIGPALFQGIDAAIINESIENNTDFFDQSNFIVHYNKVDIDGIICEEYILADVSWLFTLDLWELLNNESIFPIKCQDCGDYFMAKSKKFKFCPECNDPKTKNKRNYERRKKDPVQYYRKRINTMMEYYNIPTWEFNKELDYHLDYIKGKIKTQDPQYRIIETEEELIEWLKEVHEGLYGYNKRKDENNGKTNEESERDGSDC